MNSTSTGTAGAEHPTSSSPHPGSGSGSGGKTTGSSKRDRSPARRAESLAKAFQDEFPLAASYVRSFQAPPLPREAHVRSLFRATEAMDSATALPRLLSVSLRDLIARAVCEVELECEALSLRPPGARVVHVNWENGEILLQTGPVPPSSVPARSSHHIVDTGLALSHAMLRATSGHFRTTVHVDAGASLAAMEPLQL